MMRIAECFWMGKPCKNYPIRDFRPVCNDPDVNFCSTKLRTRYQNETESLKGFRKYKKIFNYFSGTDYMVYLLFGKWKPLQLDCSNYFDC